MLGRGAGVQCAQNAGEEDAVPTYERTGAVTLLSNGLRNYGVLLDAGGSFRLHLTEGESPGGPKECLLLTKYSIDIIRIQQKNIMDAEILSRLQLAGTISAFLPSMVHLQQKCGAITNEFR